MIVRTAQRACRTTCTGVMPETVLSVKARCCAPISAKSQSDPAALVIRDPWVPLRDGAGGVVFLHGHHRAPCPEAQRQIHGLGGDLRADTELFAGRRMCRIETGSVADSPHRTVRTGTWRTRITRSATDPSIRRLTARRQTQFCGTHRTAVPGHSDFSVRRR